MSHTPTQHNFSAIFPISHDMKGDMKSYTFLQQDTNFADARFVERAHEFRHSCIQLEEEIEQDIFEIYELIESGKDITHEMNELLAEYDRHIIANRYEASSYALLAENAAKAPIEPMLKDNIVDTCLICKNSVEMLASAFMDARIYLLEIEAKSIAASCKAYDNSNDLITALHRDCNDI